MTKILTCKRHTRAFEEEQSLNFSRMSPDLNSTGNLWSVLKMKEKKQRAAHHTASIKRTAFVNLNATNR